MQKAEFEIIIEIKVQDLVSVIMQKEAIDFLDALPYLYDSELYSALNDEETKIWHLSTEKLYDLLKNEKQNNKLEYPDFV